MVRRMAVDLRLIFWSFVKNTVVRTWFVPWQYNKASIYHLQNKKMILQFIFLYLKKNLIESSKYTHEQKHHCVIICLEFYFRIILGFKKQ